MIINIYTCSMSGLSPNLVECEIDLSFQLPTVQLVGLPSSVTQESKERIRSAVLNSGFEWPSRKVVISLLPADLPKWGSHFELAMALGVLLCAHHNEQPMVTEQKTTSAMKSNLFALGQLSLSGEIHSVGWLVNLISWLENFSKEHFRKNKRKLICIFHPEDMEALEKCGALKQSCEFISSRTLFEAMQALVQKKEEEVFYKAGDQKKENRFFEVERPDFSLLSQVREEPLGVAAALIAMLGRHHCLFAGAHGMGKSMLIRAIVDGASGLDEETFLKYVSIQKAFGENLSSAFFRGKPLVHLQSSSTRASVEGAILSTGQVIPGECTRAHLGILVADEFLEFRRDVLEGLRQILDEKLIRLQRARHRVLLPADFQLLASTNLCPCGAWGSEFLRCRCSPSKKSSYQAKLSGPILDRMDLFVVIGQKNVLSKLSKELRKMIDQMADPSLFIKHCENYKNAEGQDLGLTDEPAWLWSQINTRASDRGKLKMAKVSKTIARILGERRSLKHLLLAQELRESACRYFLPTWRVSERVSKALEEHAP